MKLLPTLSFLLFALAAPAQAPAEITIGTWNLEFLGAQANYRNDVPPRDDGDLAAIGARVRELGVAVLAVQEINDEIALQKVAAGAGPSWRFVLGTTGGWTDGATAQRIGFLYDTAVVDLLGAEELLELPRERDGVPIFHRVPVTAWFRSKATGFDFRAVTVHLKAGQKPQDEQKRRFEAEALHGWLAGLRAAALEDQDYVLLGDFNSSYGAEPEQLLERDGVVAYVDQPEPSPTIQHFADPIDQIAAGPGFDELRRTSYRVHREHGGLDRTRWRKVYSDHYPVTVQVDASTDADPTAQFRRGAPEQALPASLRAPADTASAAAGRRGWPPRANALLEVRLLDGSQFAGKLHGRLPQGPGGWLVLEIEGTLRAVPWTQIAWVELR